MMRPLLHSFAARVLALGATGLPALAADSLSLRGRSTPLPGTISRIDESGVTFTPAGEPASSLYTWDLVRSVNSPAYAAAAQRFSDTADALFRARSRLQRNDVTLALPLFESLFADYAGNNHPLALIVAQGLARCHLALGQQHLAVVPALESIRLARRGISTSAFDALPPLVDPSLSLPISLPPVFLPSPALARVHTQLAQYDAQGDDFVADLARLYALALQQSMPAQSGTQSTFNASATSEQGVALLLRLITLTSSDSSLRAAAQADTLRTLDSLPPFAQAWSRFQLGRSQLFLADIASRQAGMLNLAYLPANFRASQPFLAALALDELARAAGSAHQPAAAASLRADLHQSFPFLAPSLVPLPAPFAPQSQPASAPISQDSQ